MKKKILKINFIFLSTFIILSSTSCNSTKNYAKTIKQQDVDNNSKSVASEYENNQLSSNQSSKLVSYMGNDKSTRWKLAQIDNQDASELFKNVPVIRFDEDWKQIYGLAECNKFTTYYDKKEDNSFNVLRFANTHKDCNNDKESSFFNKIKEANEISEQGKLLSLSKDGQKILVFDKYQPDL